MKTFERTTPRPGDARMTRRIPEALALAALLAMLAACSSGGGGGNDAPVTPPGGGGTNPPAMAGNDTGPGTVGNGVIIDRMGRPGVSTALIDSAEDKDAYNANGDPNTWDAAFFEPMTERMRIVDGLNGQMNDALLNDTDTLAGLLIDDRLWIDTSRPTCEQYLSLEIGLQDGSCGGRTLRADVIDDTLRHLVSQTMPVSDLAEDDSGLLNDFPFLGPPNLAGLAEPRP